MYLAFLMFRCKGKKYENLDFKSLSCFFLSTIITSCFSYTLSVYAIYIVIELIYVLSVSLNLHCTP
jgi:hypothetical protein